MSSTITLEHGTSDRGRQLVAHADALVLAVRTTGGRSAVCGVEHIESPIISRYLEALARREVLPAALAELSTGFLEIGDRVLRLVLVGVGPAELGDDETRAAFGVALNSVPLAEHVVVFAPDSSLGALRAASEGALLGSYAYDTASEQLGTLPERALTVLTAHPDEAAAERCAQHAVIVSDAVALARDLGNAPPSALTPEVFSEIAVRDGAAAGLNVTVRDEEELREGGFGGIIGVGQGSTNPPRLVRVDYAPEHATTHIAMIGKGITFDSGGLGLKNRAAMLWMKCDMGGAAAVYAAILAISKMGLPIRVTGWLALAENMPSGTAVKPSDILRMRNGLTVEVTDTDAEGRLVMADALAVACEEEPELVLDVATLTGAQIIALGNRTSAVMARQDAAAAAVISASDDSGEAMWRLPLPSHLRDHLKSPVADLANMGGTDGGVIVGGHFLERFVPEGTAWAHLDIAGPAINTEARHGYTPHGATGAGVRTLVQLAYNASVPAA